ncbi:hypothetical protein N3K66_009090 [Trichothecium roseum]|uniref:Uncharacterized protein n=1 Tax=Trichothecium roseum TaxID=47278 RepID=A0ACC0UPI9_9HYPO|nr:hypothetical protein N3K66_009090 [Trichothecium roseum]
MNRPLGLSENKATRLRGLDLNDFINHPISADMIKVVADEARRIVPTNLAIDLCKPVETTGNRLPTLEGFITQLVKKLKISFGTLLSSLVYIRRLNSILSGYRNDYISAPDRICLVSLILAAKYLHDITYENKCWVRSTELIIKKRSVSENQRHRKEKKMRRRLVSSPDHQVILGSELETPYDGGYD